MPQLTRKEMEAVIAGGGSVLHNGLIHTSMGTLPSEGDLAKGDPEAEAAVDAALEAQIGHLQAQRAKFASRGQAATIGQPDDAMVTKAFDPHEEKASKKAAVESGKG